MFAATFSLLFVVCCGLLHALLCFLVAASLVFEPDICMVLSLLRCLRRFFGIVCVCVGGFAWLLPPSCCFAFSFSLVVVLVVCCVLERCLSPRLFACFACSPGFVCLFCLFCLIFEF